MKKPLLFSPRKTKRWLMMLAGVFLITVTGMNLLFASDVSPVAVLFDTDIGPDCDDAGALAILHAMANLGELRILGIACCTSSEWGAPCVDAINTYYGRPDIPVGTLKDTGFLAGSSDEQYNKSIAQNFPNSLKTGKNAPDALKLYRQILAAQPDNSVTFISVGPLRNIKYLLNSTADEFSLLNGIDLITKKVKLLVTMGGAYPSGSEWNFTQDIEATQLLLDKWPTPIIFSGFEIGNPIMTGKRLRTETPETNPVRSAYKLYSGTQSNGSRNSWDLTAALCAVRGVSDYWNLSAEGSVTIDAKGNDKWQATPNKGHKYLKAKMSNTLITKAIEDLMVQAPIPSKAKNTEKY